MGTSAWRTPLPNEAPECTWLPFSKEGASRPEWPPLRNPYWRRAPVAYRTGLKRSESGNIEALTMLVKVNKQILFRAEPKLQFLSCNVDNAPLLAFCYLVTFHWCIRFNYNTTHWRCIRIERLFREVSRLVRERYVCWNQIFFSQSAGEMRILINLEVKHAKRKTNPLRVETLWSRLLNFHSLLALAWRDAS